MAILVSWRAVGGGSWASPAPPGPASVFARSVRHFIQNNELIAYFGAVNIPDRRCLHPWYELLVTGSLILEAGGHATEQAAVM